MALNRIKARHDQMMKVARALDREANEIRSQLTLIRRAKSQMQNRMWDGVDENAYTASLNDYLQDAESMEEQIRNYSNCLKRAAQKYEQTQNELAAKAKKVY